MRVYKGISELESPLKNSVITIGNFDGVHLGHQELLRSVVERAEKIEGTSVAVTFRPHPRFLLRPQEAPLLLNSYDEKIELLANLGLDVLVEEPFTLDFSNTSAEQFVTEYLLKKLATKVLYLGHDFAFGKGRSGSAETIQAMVAAHGVESFVLEPHRVGGVTVSSSQIRNYLDAGELSKANDLLGRAFFVRGVVSRGDGRGRQIGVPTANLHCELRKFPRTGVYASKTHCRGKVFHSVTNIGFNPTFMGDRDQLPLKLETHIFDFSEDIYGETIQVNFYQFLRAEKKFSGVAALLAQMQLDFQEAKKKLL